ncbi:Exocyst complex protein Exo70 [Macleaya cordata]|uniref:Exocyst subunit Exo70 family protein n=1 Tax=Macleaya cordata TaxID=56857 RepID=A0A200R6A3_MACCD|nr:Exocyst complex protein Exo70 [Macleaya cordata]
MPRKGMRSVYFSTSKTLSASSSPYNYPLRSRPSIPLFSFSESMIIETISIAEEKINKWNPETSSYAKVTSLFYESRREAKEFIKCVNDLQRAMHFLLTENPSSEKLVRSQNLMQIAMKRLEKEFYQILSTNRDHFDPESISTRSSITSQRSRSSTTSDYEDDVGSEDEIQIAGNSISEVERDSALAMSDLKAIADCMISSGYGKECVKIYKVIRKSIVDEGLYRLGVEHLSSSKVHKLDWAIMELKHNNWLKAVKIAVTTLFSGERILCDEVFCTSDSIRESCFSEISREGAINLFVFPELFLKSKKSPEKIFRVLDLYNSISELWPEIESIFSFESTTAVRTQALSSLLVLGDSVRTMLSEFESTIQKDSSKSPVTGGGIHPLTEYAMNFICQLADYSVILSNIIADWPLSVQTPMPESYFESPNSDDNPMSALSIRFAWLILVVLCKLDGKAELYKDVSLAYLFLANNLQFVISKVRTSNLQFLLGEDWISKHEIKVKQYATSYERLGWDKVVSVLPSNPTVTISPEESKNCLKRFTSAFEAAYRTQSSWVVLDSKLRDEIKVSICSKLLPAYRAFYYKYRVTLRGDERNNLESSVKFSPDDLGNYLSDLFYGTGISGSSSTIASTPSSSTHSSRVATLRFSFKPRRCFSF